jgi:hypothetical protein
MLLRPVAGFALFAYSLAALAFQAVDVLTPSSSGRFLAYPADALPLSQFWVQGGVMVDNNILRQTEPPPTETVLRAGIGGRKDTYVYGRQMLRLQGRVDGYLFDRFSDLNNIGYDGLAEWHWELGNDLSGVLGAGRRQYQRDIAQLQRDVKDTITETTYVANGAYRLGPHFRVRGGVDGAEYSSDRFADTNLNTLSAVVGADFVTSLGNTLGVEYRQTRGDAPVNQLILPLATSINNTFDERTLAATVGYVSPFLRLGGELGRTKREYSELPERDFEGTTWRMSADWLLTPKTALGFETYYLPRSLVDIAASHVLVRGVAFGPGWAPTAKLNFSARIMREKQDFGGSPFVPLGVTPLRLEIVRNVRLGAYWEYTRQIHWQFAIDRGDRDSNVPGRDFKYTAVMGNVRYLFW